MIDLMSPFVNKFFFQMLLIDSRQSFGGRVNVWKPRAVSLSGFRLTRDRLNSVNCVVQLSRGLAVADCILNP